MSCPPTSRNTRCVLFQIFLKERFQLFKRNNVHLIVKVSVICTGDNEQFLIIAGQLAVRCFAEIAGVRLFSVYQQHVRADFAAVLQDWHIQERQRRRHIPATVGVQAAGMVASGRLIVGVIIPYRVSSTIMAVSNCQHHLKSILLRFTIRRCS